MSNFSKQQDISRSLLAGVLSGMIATVMCLAYSMLYERATNFVDNGINVSTTIFGVLIFFVFSSAVYHLFQVVLKFPAAIYIFSYAAVAFLCIWLTLNIQSADDPSFAKGLRGLLLGIELICASLTTFYIPYLMKYPPSFLTSNFN